MNTAVMIPSRTEGQEDAPDNKPHHKPWVEASGQGRLSPALNLSQALPTAEK